MFNLYPGSNSKYTAKTIKLKELDLRKIDYLKLDIEGAEKDLIEQASDRDFINVQQICVEIHKNANKKTIAKQLQNLNFIVKEMPRSELYAYKGLARKHNYASDPMMHDYS